MNTEKVIKTYGKNYRTVLEEGGFVDTEKKMEAFESRLREMYASENFRKHNIYPTMDVTKIYAVIAMCLEIKSFGYSDQDTVAIVNKGFEKRRNFFKRIIAVIDLLPNSFDIARKWNISDHEKRMKDGSITGKIEAAGLDVGEIYLQQEDGAWRIAVKTYDRASWQEHRFILDEKTVTVLADDFVWLWGDFDLGQPWFAPDTTQRYYDMLPGILQSFLGVEQASPSTPEPEAPALPHHRSCACSSLAF